MGKRAETLCLGGLEHTILRAVLLRGRCCRMEIVPSDPPESDALANGSISIFMSMSSGRAHRPFPWPSCPVAADWRLRSARVWDELFLRTLRTRQRRLIGQAGPFVEKCFLA